MSYACKFFITVGKHKNWNIVVRLVPKFLSRWVYLYCKVTALNYNECMYIVLPICYDCINFKP